MAENTQLAEQTKTFDMALGEKLDSIKDALPKDFNKERFVQNTLALIHDNPDLTKYKQNEIMSGLIKGATLGLDFFNKEAYLVPYGSKLNYQTDYRGAKKLAKKYSIRPIKDIYAKLVRGGDDFEESIVGGEQSFTFKPKPFNNEKIIGAFAVVLYEDGGMGYETMSLEDLENTRKSSVASNSPAWKNFTGEMYKKTVLHRLCKHIELDFENPTQRTTFMSGMEIETDTQACVESEIAENANSEDFIVADAKVVDSVKDGVEKSVGTHFDVEVPAKDDRKISTDADVPDFMKN